jgi:superkiller protein 3
MGAAGVPALAAPATAPAEAVTAEQARSLQGEGRWEEAAEAWEQVAKQSPEDGAVWFNLAYCQHAAGRLEEAIELHKKAATFDAFRGIAMYNLGCAYALVGRDDDAVDALAEAQDAGFGLRGRVEGDSDLQSLRGNPRLGALLEREKPAGWRGRMQQVVAGAKQFLTGPQVTGMLQKMAGAAQAGMAKLQQKMAGDERFAALAQKLQALLGGHGGARSETPEQSATADAAAPSGATLEQARAYQQAGDWGNAVEAYRAVLVEQPDDPAGWFGLAYCLHMSGDYEQAIAAHKESARFDQIRGIALYNLACAYALTGQPDEALDALKKSSEAGFDIEPAGSDSDLDSLREDQRFIALISK